MTRTLKNEGDLALALYDDAAEIQVISACLKDPEIAERANGVLVPDSFSEWERLLIFDGIQRLMRRAQPITESAVVTEARVAAKERGERDMLLVSVDIVARYMAVEVTALAVGNAIGRLVNLTAARQITGAVSEIVALASQGVDPETMSRNLSAIIQKTHAGGAESSTIYGPDTVPYLQRHIESVSDPVKRQKRKVLDWPWKAMNEMVVPLAGGMMGFIGAADKVGKSTISEMIAEHWAKKHKAQVGYFYTEYTPHMMLSRRMTRWSGVPFEKLLHGQNWQGDLLNAAEFREIERSEKLFTKDLATLHYVHASGWTMPEVIGQMHMLKAEGKLDAVIVDYLHDLHFPSYRGESALYTAMTEAVKALHKTLAVLDIPGLCVVRGKKEMLSAKDLDRSLIEGGSGMIYKSQFALLMNRKRLEHDGDDMAYDFDENTGRRYTIPSGKTGDLSSTINCKVDSQTAGKTGSFNLFMSGQYFIEDMPPAIAQVTDDEDDLQFDYGFGENGYKEHG